MNKQEGLTLIIYQKSNGKSPLIDWLECTIQDSTIRARIKNRLRRIELGIIGDYKRVSVNIFEIRLHFGSGYRIYFSKINNAIILLLCGGNKKTQKFDIRIAKEFLSDYLNN